MNRAEVIERLKGVEPALRAHGVEALYLFGSHSRDEAGLTSDVDIFVDPANEDFYCLDNYMGVYDQLLAVFPGAEIGYSTREGLSRSRSTPRRAAGRSRLLEMAASRNPMARLRHILDEARRYGTPLMGSTSRRSGIPGSSGEQWNMGCSSLRRRASRCRRS